MNIETKPLTTAQARDTRALVVRFAGDSGDGVQLIGLQFATATVAQGAELMTLPEFPAEIRAPAGTTFGVSAYQVQFGPDEVLTPGDEADLLIAFNPAAYTTNIDFLKQGGTVVLDEGAFTERGFLKAGLNGDPSAGEDASRRIIRVDISKMTLEAVAEFELGRRDGLRARNFWALGLALWLADQTLGSAQTWIEKRFKDLPAIAGASAAALNAGHAYGETMELALPEHADLPETAVSPTRERMISGTQAMAFGLAAVGALSGRVVHYCSYPITPASALLHALAAMKTGVRTFQAEDEIAAACAAIGASYAGQLGVTASSGPGMSLKTEAIGLAITTELPLIVIDVQRSGPSTGMPTKPEQSDLDMAVFGRHGEAPLPVLAPATPGDCFAIMLDAARIAIAGMTPVIVLSDAYLANAVSEWIPPQVESLPEIAAVTQCDGGDEGRSRDSETLALPWIAPGTPEREFRVGGLEKDAETGNISYDPANHQAMVELRAAKVTRAMRAADDAFITEGPEDGDLLVIGWGSTFGPIRQAVRHLTVEGREITHLHLRHLWPLPPKLGEVLGRYRKILCVEMNSGQLAAMLRAEYLLDIGSVSQINGRPFKVGDLETKFRGTLAKDTR